MSEGSPRQNCEPTNRNLIQGRTPRGKSAPHGKALRFRGHGKWGGCAVKVHALIRGDLPSVAADCCNIPLFGETAGRGDRLTKSRRYHESIPPDIERRNKEELYRSGRYEHREAALYEATHKVIGQKSAEAIAAKCPG